VLRLYSTAHAAGRRARRETRVVPAGAGGVRLVVAGAPSSEGRQECFVADGSGKLYATDEEGAVTYSYKGEYLFAPSFFPSLEPPPPRHTHA
jgi:hypothetical protein